MKLKKLLSCLLGLSLTVCASGFVASAADTVVFSDSFERESEPGFYVSNPVLRSYGENLFTNGDFSSDLISSGSGAYIAKAYNSPKKFVITDGALEILPADSKVATDNTINIYIPIDYMTGGNIYELDCCPLIKDERTFVPVRFIGEALQCNVLWENDTQKVLVRREKEVELNINDDEVQKLFEDILNQREFASYYGGYCDITVWDNPQNMFSGTMRELFSFLRFEKFEEKQYTKDEAEKIILDFLSEGDTSHSLSSYGIDSLRVQLEQGANFGSNSNEEILVAVYDGKVIGDICKDLFGKSLPKHENLAYAIGYHSFHLFNRVNLFYPYAPANLYNVYYNAESNQYLFTKYAEKYMNYEDGEKYDFDTKLIKATSHNGKISLYIQHYTEFDEYSGERSSYKGVYKNTYKKDENGYYWISSYGMDEMSE